MWHRAVPSCYTVPFDPCEAIAILDVCVKTVGQGFGLCHGWCFKERVQKVCLYKIEGSVEAPAKCPCLQYGLIEYRNVCQVQIYIDFVVFERTYRTVFQYSACAYVNKKKSQDSKQMVT